jgi:hypothetical protein
MWSPSPNWPGPGGALGGRPIHSTDLLAVDWRESFASVDQGPEVRNQRRGIRAVRVPRCDGRGLPALAAHQPSRHNNAMVLPGIVEEPLVGHDGRALAPTRPLRRRALVHVGRLRLRSAAARHPSSSIRERGRQHIAYPLCRAQVSEETTTVS